MTSQFTPDRVKGNSAWVIAFTVLGTAMVVIDSIAVNVALPQIGADFDASASELGWVLLAWAIPIAAFLLFSGALADRFGRRRVFCVGAAVFMAASLACAVAPTLGVLIGARVIQGTGGALLVPGALSILQSEFDEHDRARAMGLFAGLVAAVGALGPTLGGYLVDLHSWRLVFVLNAPLALALFLVARRVPESFHERRTGWDPAGTALAILGLGGLSYALTRWATHPFSDPGVSGVLLAALVVLAAFVVVERRVSTPIVPPSVLAVPDLFLFNGLTLLFYMAVEGVIFLYIINLQVVVGLSATKAGLAILPLTVVSLLFQPYGGAVATRIGPRIPIVVGMLIAAAALPLLARSDQGTPLLTSALIPMTLFGVGVAFVVAPLAASTMAAVPQRHGGIASGLSNTSSRTGFVLGIALIPLVAGVGSHLTDPVSLQPAYARTMFVCAGVLVVGALLALATPSSFAAIRARANAATRPVPHRS